MPGASDATVARVCALIRLWLSAIPVLCALIAVSTTAQVRGPEVTVSNAGEGCRGIFFGSSAQGLPAGDSAGGCPPVAAAFGVNSSGGDAHSVVRTRRNTAPAVRVSWPCDEVSALANPAAKAGGSRPNRLSAPAGTRLDANPTDRTTASKVSGNGKRVRSTSSGARRGKLGWSTADSLPNEPQSRQSTGSEDEDSLHVPVRRTVNGASTDVAHNRREPAHGNAGRAGRLTVTRARPPAVGSYRRLLPDMDTMSAGTRFRSDSGVRRLSGQTVQRRSDEDAPATGQPDIAGAAPGQGAMGPGRLRGFERIWRRNRPHADSLPGDTPPSGQRSAASAAVQAARRDAATIRRLREGYRTT